MKTINLIQGTPEWHEHRAKHFNASDAPVMLGVSSYKTRRELLREKVTGLVKDVSSFSQNLREKGHFFEEFARAEAAGIIGASLYPATGVEGKYSASFDGITMLGDVIFEHKMLNQRIEKAIKSGEDLPIEYRAQMEQQLLVSGAQKCLFMASSWDDSGTLINMVHVWYSPDLFLRQQIIEGWAQWVIDCANYKPEQEELVIKADPIMSLPAIAVQVTGMVTSSNLDHYKQQADAFFANLPTAKDLQTDEDFLNAEALVKYCGDCEKTLDQTKKSIIAQTNSIDAVIRLLDHIQDTFREKRLELDKGTKARKAHIKEQIIMQGFSDFDSFVAGIKDKNPEIASYFKPDRPNFASACKGKTIKGHKEHVPLELARARSEAQKIADNLVLKVNLLQEKAAGFEFLFSDRSVILEKTVEDLSNLVELRISLYKELEQEHLENERLNRVKSDMEERGFVQIAQTIRCNDEMISLGMINNHLGFTLSSVFLEQLGFVAIQNKASKLYKESDFVEICDALIKHIEKKKGIL